MGLFRSKKPQPKYNCVIRTDWDIRRLRIQTKDPVIIEAAKEFGRVYNSTTGDEYHLYVHYSYSAREVHDYLLSLPPATVSEPQKKRRVAIKSLGGHHLLLACDTEIADKARKFGNVYRDPGNDRYSVFVDYRYDVQEVIDYLESFND